MHQTNNKLSPTELSRYARHIAIPDFGMEGQLKLKYKTLTL